MCLSGAGDGNDQLCSGGGGTALLSDQNDNYLPNDLCGIVRICKKVIFWTINEPQQPERAL